MPPKSPSSFQPDPLCFAAIGAGLVVILASFLFRVPGWLLILGFGSVLGGVAWYVNDRFHSELRRAASEVMAAARTDEERPEAKLRRELVRLKYEPTKTAAAEELAVALVRLEDAYGEFARLLGSRLDPGEMTYGRYASAGAEVKLAAVRGLSQGAAAVASGAPVAPDRLASGDPRLRLAGLSERVGATLTDCLERNERAVQGLKRMSESLLAMRGTAGDPSRDLERALDDLRDLAARAKKY